MKSFRAKPYSVERRFQLMQSGTIVIALFLASLALYWNLSLQNRVDASLRILRSTFTLSRLIHESQEHATQDFWEAYDLGGPESYARYDKRSPEMASLLRQYDISSFSMEEAAKLERLRTLQRRFFERTAAMLAAGHLPGGDLAERAEIRKLDTDIESTLGTFEDLQIERLESSSAYIARTSIWMNGLLLLSCAVALIAIGWFRREHRQHLWLHLEELRQMVAKVRTGNLDVTAEIPASVELGSLIGAFVQMAAELREMRDSLELKVVERTASLELAHEELVQSAKLASLGQLVSGVAHEINNPLTSILGFSEVALGRSAPGSSVHSQLQTIRSEALRLRHLVANLTAFARRAPHRAQRFDLRTVLARLADLHGYQLKADNISLHLSSPHEPIWVFADAEQLTQVMLNLVLNAEYAIKSCRERGDIWLACNAERGSGFFSVRDNGSGMPPEVRDNVFIPFFTSKPTGEGTGLGLSISYGIVQQHNGKISVESAPDHGTTIRVQLPIAPDSETKSHWTSDTNIEKEFELSVAAPAASQLQLSDRIQAHEPRDPKPQPEAGSNSPPAKSQEVLSVLVIDDEDGILDMVSAALESMNCRATPLHGSSGVEAALAGGHFDLVISDLKMPGQNGAEIFRFVRENYPRLANRFLLMTGNLADAEKYSTELARVPVLSKPFTITRLRQAVSDLLGKRIAD